MRIPEHFALSEIPEFLEATFIWEEYGFIFLQSVDEFLDFEGASEESLRLDYAHFLRVSASFSSMLTTRFSAHSSFQGAKETVMKCSDESCLLGRALP